MGEERREIRRRGRGPAPGTVLPARLDVGRDKCQQVAHLVRVDAWAIHVRPGDALGHLRDMVSHPGGEVVQNETPRHLREIWPDRAPAAADS